MSNSLLKQNRWLRDGKIRQSALRLSAASSSAVEGIRKPFADRPATSSDGLSRVPRTLKSAR